MHILHREQCGGGGFAAAIFEVWTVWVDLFIGATLRDFDKLYLFKSFCLSGDQPCLAIPQAVECLQLGIGRVSVLLAVAQWLLCQPSTL